MAFIDREMRVKNISALVLCAVLWSGCVGSDDSSDLVAEYESLTVEYESVSLRHPLEWEVVTRDQAPQDIPSNILLIMSNPEPWGKSLSFASVTVAKESLDQGMSARRYAESAVKQTGQEVIDYERISEEDIELGGENGKLLSFRGRERLGGEMNNWMHAFVGVEGQGYIVSGIYPLDASEEQANVVKQIISSFQIAREGQ